MPKLKPLPNWSEEDVYLIGGGASIRGFDFTRLKGLNTIGCNQAFFLGADICNICTFGDFRFWSAFPDDLGNYGGWVVTNYTAMNPPKWLKFYRRINDGLSVPGSGELAWNGNTGALSVNLALMLGASRVFLLGYDMDMKPEETHWHDRLLENPTPAHYTRFCSSFDSVAHALPIAYPKAQVINVTNGFSKLMCFPRVSFEEVGLGP